MCCQIRFKNNMNNKLIFTKLLCSGEKVKWEGGYRYISVVDDKLNAVWH